METWARLGQPAEVLTYFVQDYKPVIDLPPARCVPCMDDLQDYWDSLRPILRGKGKRLNLQFRTFGRLYVIQATGRRNGSGSALWSCRCSCGNFKEASTDALMKGKVKSCGCLMREYQGSPKGKRKKLAA